MGRGSRSHLWCDGAWNRRGVYVGSRSSLVHHCWNTAEVTAPTDMRRPTMRSSVISCVVEATRLTMFPLFLQTARKSVWLALPRLWSARELVKSGRATNHARVGQDVRFVSTCGRSTQPSATSRTLARSQQIPTQTSVARPGEDHDTHTGSLR